MSDTQLSGGPVTAGERIDYLDILRGFAVMAIYIVNIKGMVMPFAYYANPSLWGSDIEQWIAMIQKYVVDDKWRTTFSAMTRFSASATAVLWASNRSPTLP